MALKSFMTGLARAMAIAGGFVLSLLIILTCVSILGRILNGFFHGDFMESIAPGFSKWAIEIGIGPITGDFELVEAGVAFAIFAFIPICQITAGHACVDVLAVQFSKKVNRYMRMLIDILFAAVLVLIAWRLFDGMMSKRGYGETTFLLQFPIWWAYAASFAGAIVAAIVGVYVAAIRIYEAFTGRIIIWDGVEAEQ